MEIQHLYIYTDICCQAGFKSAVELCVDCANLQSEITGVENRIKFVRRRLARAETRNIENLDSKLGAALKI